MTQANSNLRESRPASPVWVRKTKGNAKVYTCPLTDRAIVENHYGVFWNGIQFATVNDAKQAAEQTAKVLP